MTHVVVVGGGISGLAAAWFLATDQSRPRVTVLERAQRVGGSIVTEPIAGVNVDGGADAFLTRNPAAVELAQALGLGDDLIAPATGAAWIWSRGRLRRLPAGLVLGAPSELGPLWRSGIVSKRGVARAALDLILPGRALEERDPSVADLVRSRLGREVQERLVDPMIGGINAGRTESLSTRVCAPILAQAAQQRSLLRGLRSVRPAAPAVATPTFLAVRGGMGRLVSALAEQLDPIAEVCLDASVTSVQRSGSGWTVTTGPGTTIDADGVILAGPAAVSAGLVAPLSARAATPMRSMRAASVALTTLAYPADALRAPLDGSGFLVPRVERRLMTACSWVNAKWPHLATPDTIIFRASAGRDADTRAMTMDDGELVARLHRELAEMMGLRTTPHEARVFRWERAFPQFAPGHLALVEHIESALHEDAPGVELAGAWMRGVGIPTCIAGAQQAARRVMMDPNRDSVLTRTSHQQ